jgi:serine kinase of HPr protein (carbohydrate metabolism regulator)
MGFAQRRKEKEGAMGLSIEQIDQLTRIVIDEAIGIHRELGPGLFESVYEAILAGRLEQRGLATDHMRSSC